MKSATDTHTGQFIAKAITDLSCEEWHGLLASELYLLKTWLADFKSAMPELQVEIEVTHPEFGNTIFKVV